MVDMRIFRTLISGWLLIGLLLAGQFTLLAHEADHTNSLSVSAPCVFCLSHSSFDGAVPARVIAFAANPNTAQPADPVLPLVSGRILFNNSEPRAPPRHS